MKKVFISSIESKKDDQRVEEMRMTSQQRFDLAFEMIELALAVTPNHQFPPPDDGIKWIELRMKQVGNGE